jgi:predicted nucleic acid-binding protein
MEERESIYVETTIPSYITADDSRDILKLAHQVSARKFWENERKKYRLYISDFVIAECEKGDEKYARKRMALIEGIGGLSATDDVLKLASKYKDLLSIPEKSSNDAFHLALAVIHKMDYVLSLNFSHMGINTYGMMLRYNEKNGLKTPLLVAPEYFLENREEKI